MIYGNSMRARATSGSKQGWLILQWLQVLQLQAQCPPLQQALPPLCVSAAVQAAANAAAADSTAATAALAFSGTAHRTVAGW